MSEEKTKCSNCGRYVPFASYISIIYPWMWESLVNILIGEESKIKCLDCSTKLDIPNLTALLLPTEKKIYGVFISQGKNSYSEAIREQAKEHMPKDWQYLSMEKLSDLIPVINDHVLSYKAFLQHLLLAKQQNRWREFILLNWRELTPTTFAAGIIASTGLVKGIGAQAIDPTTGEKVSPSDVINELTGFFKEIQIIIWINLMYHKFSDDYSFEQALKEHIVKYGILGNNAERFKELSTKLKVDNSLSERNWYIYYAIYASLMRTEKKENIFLSDWCFYYFLLELNLLDEADTNKSLSSLKISNARAKDTITEKEAWDCVAHIVIKNMNKKTIDSLDTICNELGYYGMVSRVMSDITFKGNIENLYDFVLGILNANEINHSPEAQIFALHQISNFLFSKNDVGLIDKIFFYMLPKIENDFALKAQIESWYGRCMKVLRQPVKFLNLVGETPRKWENKLSIESKIDLWNERANSFRLMGKQNLALKLTEEMLNDIKDENNLDSQRFILLRNRGILLRETGALDESFIQLREIIKDCKIEDLAELLESFAAVCNELHRYDEAVDALEKASNNSLNVNEHSKNKLKALLAQEYIFVNRYAETLKLLDEINVREQSYDVLTLLGSIYYNLCRVGITLDEENIQKATNLTSLLSNKLNEIQNAGDFHLEQNILYLLGLLWRYIDEEKSMKIFKSLIKFQQENNLQLNPVVLAILSSIEYQHNNHVDAFGLVQKLSDSLNQRFGEILDISLAYDATWSLKNSLVQLLESAIKSKANWSQIRFISELKRNLIGRAKEIHSKKVDNVKLSDEDLLKFAPKKGQRAILEFVELNQKICLIITIIKYDKTIFSKLLELPQINFKQLNKKILYRLSVWQKNRSGDPFDLEEWIKLESWLDKELASYLEDYQYIAIINYEEMAGMPWHVALSPRWKCFYTSSWTSLLQQVESVNQPVRLGIFKTHRYEDSSDVINALAQSLENTKKWAIENGISLISFQDESADKESFEKLMFNCDIVKILCHGYTNSKDYEVALLISSNRTLPPLYIKQTTDFHDPHLLSWKDLQTLPKTSQIIFSAACSTGIQWLAGASEQMGFLGALANGGTIAVVAPRWDILAIDVLPLLDNILFRYINEKILLIDALHLTYLDASSKLPKWLAFSLSIEGGLI